MIVSSKTQTVLCPGFLPRNFLLLPGGAFWNLFGLSGDLAGNIINREAYRKPQGSYKKFQGRNTGNNFVGILEETIIS